MTALPTALSPFLAAVPPVGDDSVGVYVEIAPNSVGCVTDCVVNTPSSPPPPLAVTGAEPLSLALPVALLLAGIAATIWARRKPAGG